MRGDSNFIWFKSVRVQKKILLIDSDLQNTPCGRPPHRVAVRVDEGWPP
jgi:hypothetical protein